MISSIENTAENITRFLALKTQPTLWTDIFNFLIKINQAVSADVSY